MRVELSWNHLLMGDSLELTITRLDFEEKLQEILKELYRPYQVHNLLTLLCVVDQCTFHT